MARLNVSRIPLIASMVIVCFCIGRSKAQYGGGGGYGGGNGEYGAVGGGGYGSDDAASYDDERPKLHLGLRLKIPAMKFDLPRFSLPKITISAKIRQPNRPRTITLPEINLDTSSKVSNGNGNGGAGVSSGYNGNGGYGGSSGYQISASNQGGAYEGANSGGYGGSSYDDTSNTQTLSFSSEEDSHPPSKGANAYYGNHAASSGYGSGDYTSYNQGNGNNYNMRPIIEHVSGKGSQSYHGTGNNPSSYYISTNNQPSFVEADNKDRGQSQVQQLDKELDGTLAARYPVNMSRQPVYHVDNQRLPANIQSIIANSAVGQSDVKSNIQQQQQQQLHYRAFETNQGQFEKANANIPYNGRPVWSWRRPQK